MKKHPSRLKAYLKVNHLALINLGLSAVILCRLEMLNNFVQEVIRLNLTLALNAIGLMQDVGVQVETALQSVVRLFGGSGS